MGYDEERILNEARNLQDEARQLRSTLERQERKNEELMRERNRQLEDQLYSIRREAAQQEERAQEREARAREREFEAWIRNSYETRVTPEIANQCWTAASNGKWDLVKMALEKAPELIHMTGNIHTGGKFADRTATLLHLAAMKISDIRVLDYLTEKISVSSSDDRGDLPLYYAACYNPRAAVLEYLIKKYVQAQGCPLVNIILRGPKGGRYCNILLFEAVRNDNSLEVIQCLVSHGASAETKLKEGTTLLHCVQDAKVAEYLISQGADVNAKDKDGHTPLDKAFYGPAENVIRRHGGRKCMGGRIKDFLEFCLACLILLAMLAGGAGVIYWLFFR